MTTLDGVGRSAVDGAALFTTPPTAPPSAVPPTPAASPVDGGAAAAPEGRPVWTTPHTELPRPVGRRLSGTAVALLVVDTLGAIAAGALSGLSPLWCAFVVAILIAVHGVARMYRHRLALSWIAEVPRMVVAQVAAYGVLVGIGRLLTDGVAIEDALTSTVMWFAALTVLPRLLTFQGTRLARKHLDGGRRAVIVGASGVGAELARLMRAHPEFGLVPVGFVDQDMPPAEAGGDPEPVPFLGDHLAAAIARTGASTVVVAFSGARDTDLVDLTIVAHQLRVTILVVPRMYELYSDVRDVERLRSYPLVRLNGTPHGKPAWLVKTLIDRSAAALGLLLLSPVMAVTALAVLIESGRPVLFRQERIGEHGRPFTLLKFRSMRPADESESATRWSIAGDPRVGPVGRMLRRSSLDELPQLWNVLRGDMSLVGPRPERPSFVAEFSAAHDRYWARHRVPVGLTGLAQVNGLRGNTSIADRARFDNYYIANWSLWLDVRIVLMTVRVLLRSGQH